MPKKRWYDALSRTGGVANKVVSGFNKMTDKIVGTFLTKEENTKGG